MWSTMYGLDKVSVGNVRKSKLITKLGSENIWGIKQATFVLLDDSSRQFTTKTVESRLGFRGGRRNSPSSSGGRCIGCAECACV